MHVRRVLLLFGLATLVTIAGDSAVLYARQQPAGSVIPGRIFILNKTATDAVPVTVYGGISADLSDSAVGVLTQIANRIQPVTAARQNWEYREIAVATTDDRVQPLNAAGRDGWELVSVLATDKGSTLLLKRPVR